MQTAFLLGMPGLVAGPSPDITSSDQVRPFFVDLLALNSPAVDQPMSAMLPTCPMPQQYVAVLDFQSPPAPSGDVNSTMTAETAPARTATDDETTTEAAKHAVALSNLPRPDLGVPAHPGPTRRQPDLSEPHSAAPVSGAPAPGWPETLWGQASWAGSAPDHSQIASFSAGDVNISESDFSGSNQFALADPGPNAPHSGSPTADTELADVSSATTVQPGRPAMAFPMPFQSPPPLPATTESPDDTTDGLTNALDQAAFGGAMLAPGLPPVSTPLGRDPLGNPSVEVPQRADFGAVSDLNTPLLATMPIAQPFDPATPSPSTLLAPHSAARGLEPAGRFPGLPPPQSGVPLAKSAESADAVKTSHPGQVMPTTATPNAVPMPISAVPLGPTPMAAAPGSQAVGIGLTAAPVETGAPETVLQMAARPKADVKGPPGLLTADRTPAMAKTLALPDIASVLPMRASVVLHPVEPTRSSAHSAAHENAFYLRTQPAPAAAPVALQNQLPRDDAPAMGTVLADPPSEISDPVMTQQDRAAQGPAHTIMAPGPAVWPGAAPSVLSTTIDPHLGPIAADTGAAIAELSAAGPRMPHASDTPNPMQQTAAILAAKNPTKPDHIELTLTPETLGRLHFDLRPEGDKMAITLSAERPETLELMRRHASELLVELKQAGVQTGTLSFGTWSEGRHPSAPPQPTPDKRDTPLTVAPNHPPAPSSRRPRTMATGGMDLRF